MEEKKPTTIEGSRNEACQEQELLHNYMCAWREGAPDGESRSCLMVQASVKGETMDIGGVYIGNDQHLSMAVKASINNLSPDNLVGAIIRQAIRQAILEASKPTPREEEAEQPGNHETETHNNDEK